MKRSLYIIAVCISLAACKKDNSDLLQNNTIPANEKLSTNSIVPVPQPPSWWTQMYAPPAIDPHITSYNQVIKVNGSIYSLVGYSVYKALYKFNTGVNVWIQSNDFSVYGQSRIMFAYGSKIYIGMTDAGNNTQSNDFKSYDVATGVTTTLPSFPGTPVQGATFFVIGNKGYLLGGQIYPSNSINQLWEFNFSTNQWINKGNSPLGERVHASAFVFENKAYLGLGYDHVNFLGNNITRYKNDWVVYDPATNTSAARPNFPGQKRTSAGGFVLNGMIYVGLGIDDNNSFTDFYKYNPFANTWTQQASWPGTVSNYHQFAGFSIGTTGYVVKSALDEFWRFNVNN
ncbi:MAG: kelch repeat-containing protein [Ferruginibacter sp.]